MKAARYHSYGDSDVLVYEGADRPVAGPGQVVVKVAGAAFNVDGAAAEYAAAPAETLAAAPRTIELADAAALPSTGLTAWPALFDQRRPLADLGAVHHEADAGRLSGKTILTP
jgi:NADPH:quinone reductase-like Zn-dependent oxidoreductase